MKKLLAVLLMCTLLLASFGTVASAATPPDTLVIGTPAMNGDFIDGFGNSSYDASIKRILLDWYVDTVAYTPYDEMVINPTVVKDHSVETDEAGNKTYTWTIYDDLLWSDGSSITAKDFVFQNLYRPSAAWVEAGGATGDTGYGLIGYNDYKAGVADAFLGVKLIDEFTFSMTIDAAELPYFYEIAYARAVPMPMAVYAPGMDIVSDENGAKLIALDADQEAVAAYRAEAVPVYAEAKKVADEAAAALGEDADPESPEAVAADELAEAAAELMPKDDNYKALLANLQNVSATERFAPTVVSGPYTFVSFENQTVTLALNPLYKGNYEGKKATIPFIVQKFVQQDIDVDMVIAGDLDFVGANVEGAKIEAAKADPNTETHSYFRNGYGFLGMHCDWGVTKDPNVRWALGYLIDRNAAIDYVLGGYGGTVHAEYGFAQWMYEEAGAELEELLTPFNLNIDKANEFLDLTEWKFEADGQTPFDPAKADAEGTYMRHNASGEPLVIHHLGTQDNPVTDIIEIQYTANSPLAGVKFEVTKSDFNALLDNYYYGYQMGDDRYYNTFNLASDFGTPFDPYFSSWHSDFVGSWENSCQLADKELDEYIMGMRSLESTQKDEFIDFWLKYEKRWQDLLPQIPLYSNERFDIFSSAVGGVNTTPFATWDRIVCDLTKTAVE